MKETLLEAETILNNRPVGHLEGDSQLLSLASNMLIHGANFTLLDDTVDKDPELKCTAPPRMLKHVKQCENNLQKTFE